MICSTTRIQSRVLSIVLAVGFVGALAPLAKGDIVFTNKGDSRLVQRDDVSPSHAKKSSAKSSKAKAGTKHARVKKHAKKRKATA